jgi:hypothetical protein
MGSYLLILVAVKLRIKLLFEFVRGIKCSQLLEKNNLHDCYIYVSFSY